MMKYSTCLFVLFFSVWGNAQMGRLGDVTISTKTIVNEFTSLTSDAYTGDLILNVAQSSLNDHNRFPMDLEQGDLILIHQAQGASVNASPEPWTGNGIYGLPQSPQWGEVTNYNNCGNYEYAEVKSVISPTQIELLCGLTHDYTASGKVQIVRVPRYSNLTLTDTLTTQPWDGNVGGILAIEVGDRSGVWFNQWTNLASIFTISGVIDVNGLGFRGGIANEVNSINGGADYASINANNGGMKGESIAGYDFDYIPLGGQYGKGAPANGGGGSCAHNGGGGGGANGGDINLWTTGTGVPDNTFSTAWNLETPAPTINSGGGRGGYTFSSNDQNAMTTPPGDASWGSDSRRNQGGLGGRPLDYSTGKVFFGGGGGSGDRNDSYNNGGSGGNAGGIVFLRVYGRIDSQNGVILANGENGEDLESVNTPFWGYGGNDGAGGGGAGGTVLVETRDLLGGINIWAEGGNGGNQILESGLGYLASIDEAEGPGGGGSGGVIFYSPNIQPAMITPHVQGGANGTTNSDALSEFTPNGATSGNNGSVLTITNLNGFNLLSIEHSVCFGDSAFFELNVDTLGFDNGGWYSAADYFADSSIIWYDTYYNVIGTGDTLITGAITSDTSFFVGTCPYRSPLFRLEVKLGSSFTLDTTGLTVVNEHCNQGDGSISGIVATGGYQPLTYEWNGTPSTQADTSQLSSGNYSLKITDNNGCAVVLDSITIENESGPLLDTSNVSIADESCGQLNGGVQGVTLQGGSSPYVYTWDGNVSTSLDTVNLLNGIHQLMVEDAYGCKDSVEITIGEIPAPVLDTTNVVVHSENCNQLNGSIQGISVQGGTSPYTYNWNGTASTLDLNGISSGTYQLIVVDDLGCSDTVSFVVGETLPPVIDTTNMVLVPESCGAQNGSISGIEVTGGIPSYNYWWNGNQSSSLDINHLQGGNYTLLVLDDVGCRDSISVDVSSLSSPVAGFIIPDTVYSNEEFLIQNNSSTDVVSWLYLLGNGTQSQLENPIVMYEENGDYLVCLRVENNNGCTDSICENITAITHELPLIVPNVFTPNNDGENDNFVIFGLKETYGIQIYNRWGKLLFEATPYLNDWKGKSSSGAELSEGTYYYIITEKDKEITKGYFSLFR